MEKITQKGVEVSGLENLLAIQQLNAAGRHVIFAPNHVSPNSKVKTQLAMAEDYPKLRDVLEENGLPASVLFRGDGDIEVGDSRVRRIIYDIHRAIFSRLGRLLTGGVPLNINAKEPKLAQRKNLGNVREVLHRLKKQNMVIYPYGNWFKAGEQQFDENLPAEGYAGMENFEKWRQSLKSGFVRFAKMSGCPIVPVYVDNTGGEWKIRFGEPIEAPKETSNEELGQRYLQAMQLEKQRLQLPMHSENSQS